MTNFSFEYHRNSNGERWYNIINVDADYSKIGEFYYDDEEGWVCDPHEDCNRAYTVEEMERLLEVHKEIICGEMSQLKVATCEISEANDLSVMDGSA